MTDNQLHFAMKKTALIATTIFLFLFCSSCTSIRTLVINVEKPAEITLPKTINNICIVNNATPQPDGWGHFDYKYTNNEEITEENIWARNDSTDIILSETLFGDLVQLNYFDSISIYGYALREDTSFLEEKPIAPNIIQDISQQTNSDAVLAINRFLVSTASHEEPYSYDTDIKFLDAKIDAIVKIYSKTGQPISENIHFSDSIYWTALYAGKFLISDDSLPSREEAIKEVTYYAAEKISKALVPSWIDEPRILYGDSKAAVAKTSENDWKGALAIWKIEFDKTDKTRKKARIAHDIALAYELSDDIGTALEWSEKSVQLFSEVQETSIDKDHWEMAKNYHDVLLKRANDFKILNIRQ